MKIFEAIIEVILFFLKPLLIIGGVSLGAFVIFSPFVLSMYMNSSGPGHSDSVFWMLIAFCSPWALLGLLVLSPIFLAVRSTIQERNERKARNRFQPRIMPEGYETASDVDKKRMEMDYWHREHNYEYVTSSPAKRVDLAEKDWAAYRQKLITSDACTKRF